MITAIIALFLIELVVLSTLVNTDHGIWGLFSLIVAGATYGVFIDSKAVLTCLQWLQGHPLHAGLYALGYIGIGVVWSFFKYYSFVRTGKKKGIKRSHMEASDNTAKVITWTAYWPISAILHVVGDGVYKMYTWVYDQVSGVYDRILSRVYGD